jgi:hypothetical protein
MGDRALTDFVFLLCFSFSFFLPTKKKEKEIIAPTTG